MHNKLLKRKNNSVHRFAIIANHYFPLSKAKPPVKVLNAKGSVTPTMAVRLELAFGKQDKNKSHYMFRHIIFKWHNAA